MKLTKTQKFLFERWRLTPAKLLIRWPGGFWTLDGTDSESDRRRNVPAWWVSIGTVRALDKLGYTADAGNNTRRLVKLPTPADTKGTL